MVWAKCPARFTFLNMIDTNGCAAAQGIFMPQAPGFWDGFGIP